MSMKYVSQSGRCWIISTGVRRFSAMRQGSPCLTKEFSPRVPLEPVRSRRRVLVERVLGADGVGLREAARQRARRGVGAPLELVEGRLERGAGGLEEVALRGLRRAGQRRLDGVELRARVRRRACG